MPGAGLDISQWGPQAWKFMHAVTFAYPDNPTPEEKQAAISFFSSLSKLLPCEKCRDHFSIGLEVKPVEQFCNSKADLSRWLVDFHNAVNARLGKAFVEYEEMCKVYLGSSTSTAATRSCAMDLHNKSTSSTENGNQIPNQPSPPQYGNSYFPMIQQMNEHAMRERQSYPQQRRVGEFSVNSEALVADDYQVLPSGQHAVCPLGARGNTNEDAKNAFNLLEEAKEKNYIDKGKRIGAGIASGVILGIFALGGLLYYMKKRNEPSKFTIMGGREYSHVE
jgi:hypothetical protein